MTYTGRGAWFPVGGTLKKDRVTGKTVPGPYYMRPTKGIPAPGAEAQAALDADKVPDLNEHAVWYGVLAVKTRLVELDYTGLTMDGVYGRGVKNAVTEFQSGRGLGADGVVGPATARALFESVVHEIGSQSAIGSRIGCGMVTNESAYDPGAVGKVDYHDHGLCQLNAESQHFTLDESFTVRIAVERMYLLLDAHLAYFRQAHDAIAAYNLGRTGAKLWISEGRPQMFIPASQRDDPAAKPRDVLAYISRITTSCTATEQP